MMKNSQQQRVERTGLADWLWRPWYAKCWWTGVVVYWLGMVASLNIDALADIYYSAAGGYLNIMFFPPIVAVVLLFGFLRRSLKSAPAPGGEIDEEDFWDGDKYGPSGTLREFDPLDPASGALWIGSPLNPLNPGYINRHPS